MMLRLATCVKIDQSGMVTHKQAETDGERLLGVTWGVEAAQLAVDSVHVELGGDLLALLHTSIGAQ